MEARLTRRLVGALAAGLADADLGEVSDPRRRRGRRWALRGLLVAVVAGLCCGKRSLAEIEEFTAQMSVAARRALGLSRRVPDTTMRDALVRIAPGHLLQRIFAVIRKAHRRKALTPDGLPFGVLALDGKSVTLRSWDEIYAQRVQSSAQKAPHGLLRTFTATLVSCQAAPCLGAFSVPANTNEMGAFGATIRTLTEQFATRLDLFRMVMTDAGSCSLENASLVRELCLHYMMRLTDNQPTLFRRASAIGWGGQPELLVRERRGLQRVHYELWISKELTGAHGWTHLRGVVRVRRTVFDEYHNVVSVGVRMWLTSMPKERLTLQQWATLVRRYWRVESTHNVLDIAFAEDDRVIIDASPQGALCALLLRRIAYNLVVLYRNVTQRSERERVTPYKSLMSRFAAAMIAATQAIVAGLRRRSESSATSA